MRFKRLRILFNRTFRRKEFELKLKSVNANFETDTLQVVGEHPFALKMAEEMVDLFIDSGATNYLELRLFNPADMNSYIFRIQRGKGATPAEINVHLRYALEHIEKKPEGAAEVAANVLREVGYKEPLKVRPRPPSTTTRI